MNTKDSITEILISEGVPTLTQDQLLEKYGTKYLMYLYMVQTEIIEIEKIEREYDVRNSGEQAGILGKRILEKYGEAGLAYYMLAKFPEFRQIILHNFRDIIHQRIVDFLIK